jgi:hypothetical protein
LKTLRINQNQSNLPRCGFTTDLSIEVAGVVVDMAISAIEEEAVASTTWIA